MKRTAFFTVLLLAVLLSLTACGGIDIKIPQSVSVPSAVSQTSKEASDTKQSSTPESSAPESSAPESSAVSEPEQSSEPEKDRIWLADELSELLASKGIDGTSSDITEGVQHDYKGVLYTKAELVFTGGADETAEMLLELASFEKDGLYLTNMDLTKSADVYTVSLRLENPYSDPEGSSDSAKAYIKSHWGELDRAALIKAFVDENMDFRLTSAKALLFSDKNGRVSIAVGIDFSVYEGFVTYKYKLSNSQSFTIDGGLEVKKTSGEDDECPLHTDAVLLTDKFTKQQV